jgi:hypothetical protein
LLHIPVGGARGGATGAEDALIHAIELLAIHSALKEFTMIKIMTALYFGLQPRLDGLVLGVEVGHVRNQVFDDVGVWQRIDLHGRR